MAKQNISQSVGKRVHKIRKTLGYSVTDFARKLGYNDSYLIRFEKGQTLVTGLAVNRICSRLGVRREWLLDGEGEMSNDNVSEIQQFLATASITAKLKLLSDCLASIVDDVKDPTPATTEG